MRGAHLLLATAVLHAGCQAQDTRSQQMRQWLSQSRQGCEATAAVLQKLRRGVSAVEKVYADELERTTQSRRPFQRYNPQFLGRLEAALRPLDTTRGPLANRLARDVWPSHYRLVKAATEVLPRLHRFLVLLAELRSTVAVARHLESRYSAQLRRHLAQAPKPPPGAAPRFGVRLKSARLAQFLRVAPPVTPKPGKPPKCAPSQGTTRVFSAQDTELMNRVECRGRSKIVYTAYLYHLVQIQLILARIKKLDPRGLAIAFRRSAE